ncbi:uncharacterized protein LOC111360624 [Spodoptera litura]|uniref:Uncharacterized protein LOC111360624 n=1 Tax=Spodoptera litura TaxID=69820 RepID=A0A9J7J0S3_SPOLT|nr:uncharacterized protein LOC111360624 [Spodoptera litura]
MPKTPKIQYSKENLQKAIDTVQDVNNKLSTRQIAEKYGVPRSSLRYYIKHPGHKTSLGPSPVLTISEENSLEDWIIISARKGFPRNKEDILDTVQKFLIENPRPNTFLNNRPGDGWWKAFLKRHPRLATRTSEGVTKASACVSEKDIRGWFTEIQNYATEKDLASVLNDPHRVFNADETNFQICVKTGQVLAEKGSKNVYNVEQSQAKESITVLFTFSAAGDICCPFIVYPYQRLPEKIADSVPDGWGLGKSDTGWMTTEVFYEYIANVFYPYLVSKNVEFPVILYVDGHKTHLNFHLSQLCTHLQIELIALYPNATRILQPADVAAFRPLKVGWRKSLRKWQNEHNNQSLTKLNFAPVLNDAVMTSLRPEILVNGFKACGLCPFNPDAIDYGKCLGAASNKLSVQNTKPIPDLATITYSTFSKIVGPSIVKDFENRRHKLPHQKVTEHLDMLFKLWESFKHAEIESNTNEVVDCSVITQENNEDSIENIVDLHSLTEETSEGIESLSTCDLFSSVPEYTKYKPTTASTTLQKQYTPEISSEEPRASTSFAVAAANSTPQLPSPKIIKRKYSLGEYLAYPETPIRKGKRQTERQPYDISSQNFKEALHVKVVEKQNLLKIKEEKKLIRDKKKAEKSKNTIKITKKPNNENSAVNINSEVDSEEIDTIKGNNDNETETFKNHLQCTPKTKELNISHKENKQVATGGKITILSDIIIKPTICVVCHFSIMKNPLTCSACSKTYHMRCIPQKHKEHIPDDADLRLFL